MSEGAELKKFPKVRPIGHPETDTLTDAGQVIVQEKMDGANFRFRRDGDGIAFGSRNVVYRDPSNIPEPFQHAVEFVRDRVGGGLDPALTYFGEAMHEHTLDYNWDDVPSALGFAVYNHISSEFVRWEVARMEFNAIDIPTVPIVERVDPAGVTGDYDIPQSEYRDGVAEGVVFWHSRNCTRAKLRSEEFKERHDAPVSEPEDYEGHGKLVTQFCTDVRVDKRINDLLDEGHTLSRELMGQGLPQAVSRDILEEHADEIVSMNETVDLKEYRSLVAKQCLQRIDERMRGRTVEGDVDA